ncbi:MAG TPA: ABC transporter ATP-binding protein [Nitrolancea sp.]|nr:ABC transporter ATP-binding protein [Nitrolancea sp.]
MADAIVCQGLVKRYGDVTALDHLDLTVPEGSIFGFLGPNGSGKTTTIRLLTGLSRPTDGQARVAGYDVTGDSIALRRRISYLDQQPQFYNWMRGRELLEFTGQLFGLHGAELSARVVEVLALTGIADAAERKVGGYSGGMRQRLGLAQALINQPDVLFLDEPVSSLDPAGRHDLLSIIDSLRATTTVFMSSHILADIERVCDRVAIINRGRLVVEASVTELQARYALPIVVVEVEHADPARLAALRERISAQPWASGVTFDREELRVGMRDHADAGSELLRLLADSGVPVVRYEHVRPYLEDIFLRLVGGKEST